MYKYWLILLLIWIKAVQPRTVPARQELCQRFPNMEVCRSSSSATANDAPSPISAPRPAAAPSVPSEGLPTANNLDRDSYCNQYQPHFSYYCAADRKASNSKQAAAFCDSYTSNCDIRTAPQANSDLPSAAGLGVSPTQVKSLCDKYRMLAQVYCKGNEPGDIKKYCELYRTYCLDDEGKNNDVQRTPAASTGGGNSDPERDRYCSTYKPGFYQHCSEPTNEPKTVQFCQAYNDYCHMGIAVSSPSAASGPVQREQSPPKLRGMVNANTSAVVRAQCEQYKSLADVYCPGYEVSEMRQNCNMYRVYCQGKAPFPGIDGNIGWNNNVWGVAGIPFYPFNPQGAIAGGKRSNVGYGDWGGSYTERDGVSDFYDTQRKVEANWQKGNYMVNDGWNVPLAGISGFRQNGVNLGGLGNPSDWPALQSGGLPIPAFGNGLGPMPNFGGSANGMPLIGK